MNVRHKYMKYLLRYLFPLAVLVALLASNSCCNRPYMAGYDTWPVPHKYPRGPYQFLVGSYRIQTGRCPGPHDLGSKICISIWDFGQDNRLFHDTFRSEVFFEDVYARFAKDGSVIVTDDKSHRTIRRYSRISDRQWRYQP